MRGRERERGNKSIIEVQREGDTYPTCNERPTRERDGGGSNERGRERHRIREKPERGETTERAEGGRGWDGEGARRERES